MKTYLKLACLITVLAFPMVGQAQNEIFVVINGDDAVAIHEVIYYHLDTGEIEIITATPLNCTIDTDRIFADRFFDDLTFQISAGTPLRFKSFEYEISAGIISIETMEPLDCA